MHRALNRAVAIFTDQETRDATEFDWSQITVDQVRKLRSVLVAGNAAAGTVNHVLSGVRSTVRIACKQGLVDLKTRIEIEDEPNEKPPQQRQSSERYVKPGEVRQLFAVLGADAIGARDAAMLALLYGAGLKRSEAAELRLADYDGRTGKITVRPGERDERLVCATNGGKEAIDVWIKIRGDDWPGALLTPVGKGGRIRRQGMSAQAVLQRMRTIAEQANVASVITPKDLRRMYLLELERQQLDARKRGRPEPAPMMLAVPYQAPS